MVVFGGLLIGAIMLVATFATLGIGGSVVTWSIVEILKSVAIGIVGIAFIIFGIFAFWMKRHALIGQGKGLKDYAGLAIPVVLLLIGAIFLDPQGFGVALASIAHLIFFGLGVLLTLIFVIPALMKKIKVSDTKLALTTLVVMFFFALGVPNVLFSAQTGTMSISSTATAGAPDMLQPFLNIGSIVLPNDPMLGFFLACAAVGFGGFILLKKR